MKNHAQLMARLLLGGTLLAPAGCGDVLEVESPDIVRPENLETAAGLEARRRGAFGDFVVAFTGQGGASGVDGHIQKSGLLADELKIADTQTGRTTIDARRITDRTGDVLELFANLHRARRAAESAADAYRAFETPPAGSDAAIAEMLSLAGYTYLYFAEDFCAGVPFSRVAESGDIEFGAPTTTVQVYELAGERFDEALAAATRANSVPLQRLARLGKGRALLGLGRHADAAAAVAGVPTDYQYLIRYAASTERQMNGLFNIINDVERMSVVNREGSNGIDFFEAFTGGDPRTPFQKDPRNGVGFDSAVEMFLQLKFPERLSPIPLAEGVEARLIEAEAALQARDLAQYAQIHNALRARRSIAPLATTGLSFDQVVNQHFRERALWLWLQGHRLGDLRRLVRQYGRNAESVFPTGAYTTKPTFPSYGTSIHFPLPFDESNNPNAAGCTSTGA